MNGLTSITINKNSRGFAPKLNKRTQRKSSLLSINEPTLNKEEFSTEKRPKVSTFIKKSTPPNSTLLSTDTSRDSSENNISTKRKRISTEFDTNSLESKQKKNTSIATPKESKKKRGKLISAPTTVKNIPTDNNKHKNKNNIPSKEMTNKETIMNKSKTTNEQTNDKGVKDVTTMENKMKTRAMKKNKNNDHNHTVVSTPKAINLSQNNIDHSFFINNTITTSSTSKSSPPSNNNNNNNNYSQNTDNRKKTTKRNKEYSFIEYNGSSENKDASSILKRCLLQFIAEIPHTSKGAHNQHQNNTKEIKKNNSSENEDVINSTGDSNDTDFINGNEDEEKVSQQEQNILQECSNALQVRIVNGEIVLNDSSLYIETKTPETPAYEYIEEDERSRIINSQSHRRFKTKAKKWTKEETDLFYQGLKLYGTDFEMIANTIPSRNRLEIKNMYNRQEKISPMKITEAVLRRNSSS